MQYWNDLVPDMEALDASGPEEAPEESSLLQLDEGYDSALVTMESGQWTAMILRASEGRPQGTIVGLTPPTTLAPCELTAETFAIEADEDGVLINVENFSDVPCEVFLSDLVDDAIERTNTIASEALPQLRTGAAIQDRLVPIPPGLNLMMAAPVPAPPYEDESGPGWSVNVIDLTGR